MAWLISSRLDFSDMAARISADMVRAAISIKYDSSNSMYAISIDLHLFNSRVSDLVIYSTFTGLVEHVDSVTDFLAQMCIVSAFVTNCYKLAFVDMVDCLRTIEKRGHGPRGAPLFMRV